MSETELDVVAVGNALVDVLSHEEHAFLNRSGLARGTATMVDLEHSDEVYGMLGPTTESSGGSAANTIAGLASLGGRGAFIGQVADDDFGRVFAHDLAALGVRFHTGPASGDLPTGRCLVVVTPDAQRTMCTYLGISSALGPDAVDDRLIAAAAVTYLEGYLWDQPPAKEAIRAAAAAAHAAGRRVALTLSDPFCVDRHRDEFRELVESDVDVLFANELEICSLYEENHFDDALIRVRDACGVAALTRSEAGAVVVGDGEVHVVDAVPVDAVVDTTGAGDQFAAGFLYGLTHGLPLGVTGRLGALCASEVIGHLGPRPAVSLRELAGPLIAGA
ncbi:MAG: adenosine kinase [Acidimicrobiia bacterium]|nr:adenosine kinase [Acidimicrobiia bacterium]